MGEVIQKSKTILEVSTLDMLAEFNIGSRKILLHSASIAPTTANTAIHARIGFEFTESVGKIGTVDFVQGLARRYYPVVLPYARKLQGPGKIYAAILVQASGTGNPFTFNVAYEVIG